MGFGATFYNLVLKRTSTFTVAVLATAFIFERGFDMASEKIFDTVNKGVSVLLYLLYPFPDNVRHVIRNEISCFYFD